MNKMGETGSEGAPAPAPAPAPAETAEDEAGWVGFRRDRLLAALTLICGLLLALALPFALRFGAEFFLPVTAALVIAIALVPLLEWFERRGLPSVLIGLLFVRLGSRGPLEMVASGASRAASESVPVHR